ncbi:hypothetical protein Ahy_B05g078070 isoform A [Arachis hypogaea]|uniref:Glycosyltransferase family 92 protein n=1 Tax=Arachis hypogaea TaxID=3818 RepID=A0A444Z6A1_ARAHY|nr:hypothetical protein Ahy_B05g078070 isoform A [Arachis hypogaea]
MEAAEQRRKRKRGRHILLSLSSSRSLFLCSSFIIFILFMSSHHRFFLFFFNFNTATLLRPPLALSLLYSSATSNSILDPLTPLTSSTPSFTLQHRIQFPNHYLLLLLTNHHINPHQLECVYYYYTNASSSSSSGSTEPLVIEVQPVLSTDRFDESRSIARCPFPRTNGTAVDLRRRGGNLIRRSSYFTMNQTVVQSWEKGVYEASLDRESNTVVVFVKGLNLRPHKVSDPTHFRCHFGFKNLNKDGSFLITTIDGKGKKKRGKYELCVCTMVWNQGSALREWVMYHAWLGVERWFIYDNNSDDDIEEVIQDLDSQGFNVTRQVWPWIKTQEAGFSHCALKARDECKWVGFFDVDEFFYFPNEFHHQLGQGGTACHSFGPSGLRSHPKQGVTVGYTCRLQSPERHKSIVRPDLLHVSLLNVVHHFQLREGFRYVNMPEGSAVINHYKYQVWDTFKAKFFRRVATYVVDWQEDQNKGSKDRAPGLGTEAIEPPNWHLRFCEVWDTGLKDFLLSYFADPVTGLLPWDRSLL